MLRKAERDLPAAWHLDWRDAGRRCVEMFQRTQSTDLRHLNVEHFHKLVAESQMIPEKALRDANLTDEVQ